MIVLLALGAAALLAYGLKGLTGFGPALLLVPLLTLTTDVATALLVSALLDLLVGGVMMMRLSMPHDRRALLRLGCAIALGAVVGAALVGVLAADVVLGSMAAAVLVAGVRLLRAPGGTRRGPRWEVAYATAAGVSGGLIGISGPLLLAGVADRPVGESRRLLVALFFAENAVRIPVYLLMGTASMGAALGPLLVILPCAAVGVAIGMALMVRDAVVRRVEGVLLLLVGAALVAALLS